ncbi:alpha/beta-type small acid-soluble spore protein [Cellulosilyticum sp. I15G10I2]|uniref:alpha/beta-type small acid-soluble spore protein n=1 Tax=Cellulosilyticum sp. I15G10I2 TaxID=1892843 RepID=UPI00085C0280|nr:alpha/beta-type small acid-soluble spore protein [Cellulosilyticum sp. I15G10I2]
MSSKNNSAFESMKYEVAKEVGVPLKQGYNGDLTAREAGRIGGTIVQKVFQNYKGSSQQ